MQLIFKLKIKYQRECHAFYHVAVCHAFYHVAVCHAFYHVAVCHALYHVVPATYLNA